MSDVRITRVGAERLCDIEPLWKALQEHAIVAPTLGGHGARSPEDAWRRRRVKHEAWLGDPDAFLLFAERIGRPVGYALVTLGEGPQGWATGERVAGRSRSSRGSRRGRRHASHGCRGGGAGEA